MSPVVFGLSICAALVITGSCAVAGVRHHRRETHAAIPHRHGAIRSAASRGQPGRVYGYVPDPTPTCRYADGTPFDPDIIGGPNHVGDGGPAANLGGFDPCGF